MERYEAEEIFLIQAVKEAYEEESSLPLETKSKGAFDLVTALDVAIEKNLRKRIGALFPEDHILGEEESPDEAISGRTWTLDPIDGTVNMAGGSPLFGVQAALIEEGTPVASALYFPKLGLLAHARLGNGAYVSGKPMHVKDHFDPNDALFSFGDFSHKFEDAMELQKRRIDALCAKVAKIRLFGAACFDLYCVASGITDAHHASMRNPWDVAPGMLLVQESGGLVTDLEGNPYRFGATGVVAASCKEALDFVIHQK